MSANEHYDFIIMVKGMKQLVCDLVKRKRGSFETVRDCSIRPYRVYGTTVKQKLFADDAYDRWFHIYHNPGREAAEREQLEIQLDRQNTFFAKLEGKKIEFSATCSQYFDLFHDAEGIFLYARENKQAIQETLKLCGYFVIVSSAKMTAKDALVLYKSRDSLEKLFSGDKTFLGSKSMRVHSQEHWNAPPLPDRSLHTVPQNSHRLCTLRKAGVSYPDVLKACLTQSTVRHQPLLQ